MTSNKLEPSQLRSLLDLLTTLVVLVAAGAFLWKTTVGSSTKLPAEKSIPIPTEPVSLAGAPRIGSPNARVAIIEFADFQCPFCARFAKDILPQIKAKYVDSARVLFAFRHNPLTQIHLHARTSAHASECAHQQDKFWAFHDRLFIDPPKLDETHLLDYAHDAGLDTAVFQQCLGGSLPERVAEDSALAERLRLTGTPVFFVGRLIQGGRVNVSEVLTGVRAPAEFATSLDRILQRRD